VFTTTEFARIGMVPARLLRCYESTGLLLPRRVDPAGQGCYEANQLPRLNRILALSDLGFTLPQVWALLQTEVSDSELRGILRLRRAELAAKISADTTRLARAETRLAAIANEVRRPRIEIAA
jgi:DNA-binding transcriptional MerR regulator